MENDRLNEDVKKWLVWNIPIWLLQIIYVYTYKKWKVK
jgi:hypothetical protein